MEAIKNKYSNRFVNISEPRCDIFKDMHNEFTSSIFNNQWIILPYGSTNTSNYDYMPLCTLICGEDSWKNDIEGKIELFDEIIEKCEDAYYDLNNLSSDDSYYNYYKNYYKNLKILIEVLEENTNIKNCAKNWYEFLKFSAEEHSLSWLINTNINNKYYLHVIFIDHQFEESKYLGHISNVIENVNALVFDIFDKKISYDNYKRWDYDFLINYLKEKKTNKENISNYDLACLLDSARNYNNPTDTIKPILENAPESFIMYLKQNNHSDILTYLK